MGGRRRGGRGRGEVSEEWKGVGFSVEDGEGNNFLRFVVWQEEGSGKRSLSPFFVREKRRA